MHSVEISLRPLVYTLKTCTFASAMPTACGPLALLLHAAVVGAFGGVEEAKEFVKVELPNAKCLDGSPAVYYIAANASSTAWLVYARADAPMPPPRPRPAQGPQANAHAHPGPVHAMPTSSPTPSPTP